VNPAARGRAADPLRALARTTGVLGPLRRLREMASRVRPQVRRALSPTPSPAAYLARAREVRRTTGKAVAAQLAELVALRLGPGRLRPLHYYQYDLYDDARFPRSVKREFMDWPVARLGDRLNDPEWRGLSKDKLTFYSFLRGAGISHPPVLAVYHPGGRHCGDVPRLRAPAALAEHLRTRIAYPFFGKPVFGTLGRGASLVESYDRASDTLRLADGKSLAVDEYVRRFAERFVRDRTSVASADGYLLQAAVAQHPALRPIIGDRVSTLRMVVLVYDDGPRLFRVVWRVPTRGQIVDNFSDGAAGNVLGLVDREQGVVRRALHGRGTAAARRDLRGPGAVIEAHPDTGQPLIGLRLPCWDEALALCLTAAASVPRVRYQSWDVALGPGGPTIIELNFNGHVTQPGQDRGFLDPELRAFLAKYGK
jgi:hypothetical protein